MTINPVAVLLKVALIAQAFGLVISQRACVWNSIAVPAAKATTNAQPIPIAIQVALPSPTPPLPLIFF